MEEIEVGPWATPPRGANERLPRGDKNPVGFLEEQFWFKTRIQRKKKAERRYIIELPSAVRHIAERLWQEHRDVVVEVKALPPR